LTQGNPKGRINAEPSACNGRKCALADNAEKQFVSHFLPVLQMLLPEKQSLPTGGARVCLATKSRKDKAWFVHQKSQPQTSWSDFLLMVAVAFE